MSNDNERHGRTAGVTFGPLKRALREHRYPVSVGELIEQYGGFELETGAGSERLETALERCERRQFHEPREVRDAILGALDDVVADERRLSPEGTDAEESDAGAEETGASVEADDWSGLSS
ncbi:hypothetical protein U4E84_09510 [Halorubrum sp. AD140]|uniref:DUF5789 family protein n=1 Tax=Halorubrum sp. AD140 TaxID=3050073 RepID=UPI002ACCDB07|nr:hypothetical protein [Halorubrum sp. AD140]MDZ5811579.1 hypothetical protein [Halorubrum sp. AD140]